MGCFQGSCNVKYIGNIFFSTINKIHGFSDSPRIVSDGEVRSPEKEIILQPLENEINNILSKETNWIRFKTEKLESIQHDSIKKFRTELLREQMTIDINQLKLDMNLDAHLKNRVINTSSKQGTMQDQKQGQTIKSATQNSAEGSSNKNMKPNVFIFE